MAGQRIRKQVYTSSDGSNWTLSKTHSFFYDTVSLGGGSLDFGLLSEEIVTDESTSQTITYQYLWGPDVDGSYHGLGGVGGLIAVINTTDSKIYIPQMDAKGTVYKYIDADTGAVAAEFDYDPYGRVMQQSGEQLANLSLRYQTKYHDTETSSYYYGMRHYDPATCRWFSRDPLEEAGGYNLYAFVNNDPINDIDYLGLDAIKAILDENPAAKELMYTIAMLRLIQKTRFNQIKNKMFSDTENHAYPYGRFTDAQLSNAVYRDKLIRKVDTEIRVLQNKLKIHIKDAKYDVLLRSTGWVRAALIEGVNGFGMKSLFEAFSKDTIYAAEQTVGERIFKGIIGTIEIAGIVIPVGRVGGKVLGKLASKFPKISFLNLKPLQLVSKLKLGKGGEATGYHATTPEAAASIKQNGFNPGTKPGRLGAGGTYVNNTRAGAIAEFKFRNPGVEPKVLTVKYRPGINAKTSVSPRNYVKNHPLNVDSISAPSVRLPGTINTNILNGTARIP